MLSLLVPLLMVLLPIVSGWLIVLVLVQRGRGGGLVGAFGGMGGQSAFGARAGDLFTKITVVTVCIWLAMCIVLLLGMKYGGNTQSGFGDGGGRSSEPTATVPAAPTPVTTPIPASPTP
jgi:preprotein translocase subunit SecG